MANSAQQQLINDLLPVGILLVDAVGLIVSANQLAHKLFEYDGGELVGLNVDSLVPAHVRHHHKALRDNYQQAPKPRKMAAEVDFLKGFTRTGKEIPLEIGLAPVELANGHHVLVTLLDISERKKLVDDLKYHNEKMNEAIVRLTQSNEQLERFAYICSHDLQEPVRMVQSFSQLLSRRLEGQLDEKCQNYLQFITDGAERARNMISDILTFCRLDQSVQGHELVALADICDAVEKTLRPSLDERNGQVEWQEPLPTLMAVHTQLFQLILNLVANGLKFNRSEQPLVRIWAESTASHWLIHIEDNGIGIKPMYQEKIFQIFERLHTKNEFPGTGIGLATCLKIAKSHDADIQVSSEEGKGSRFTLLWPLTSASLVSADESTNC